MNVGGGREPTSVNRILEIVAGLTGVEPEPKHTPPREGDVLRTEADVSLARRLIGYEPKVDIEEGLRRTVEWFRSTEPGRLPSAPLGRRLDPRPRAYGQSSRSTRTSLPASSSSKQADVAVDHQRDELLEAGPGLPTELSPSALDGSPQSDATSAGRK